MPWRSLKLSSFRMLMLMTTRRKAAGPLGIDLGLPKGRCWHGPNYYYYCIIVVLNTLNIIEHIESITAFLILSRLVAIFHIKNELLGRYQWEGRQRWTWRGQGCLLLRSATNWSTLYQVFHKVQIKSRSSRSAGRFESLNFCWNFPGMTVEVSLEDLNWST